MCIVQYAIHGSGVVDSRFRFLFYFFVFLHFYSRHFSFSLHACVVFFFKSGLVWPHSLFKLFQENLAVCHYEALFFKIRRGNKKVYCCYILYLVCHTWGDRRGKSKMDVWIQVDDCKNQFLVIRIVLCLMDDECVHLYPCNKNTLETP